MQLQKLAQRIVDANTFNGTKLVSNIDTDIMYCTKTYAEPKVDYNKQEKYWFNQDYSIKSMAHNQKVSGQDKQITSKFLELISVKIGG